MKKKNPTFKEFVLMPGFKGELKVIYAPLSKRYWNKGDIAKVERNQVRINGISFPIDERYIFEELELKRAGVAVDNYKLEIFKKGLLENNFFIEDIEPLYKNSSTIFILFFTVKFNELEQLIRTLEAKCHE